MTPITNIADLRALARRRVPRILFDYVESGSYDEITLKANLDALQALRFRQRVLVDTTGRSLESELVGSKVSMPLAIAPTGLTGLVRGGGEILAARAAEAAGIPYCLSTMSIATIEDIRAATRQPFWFQLYVLRDRGFSQSMIERATLDRALGLKPDMFAVRLERGLYALRDERWSDAAAEFEAVLASAPRHADARCLLGTALAAMGRKDAAARCFEEALAINPDYVDALKKLAHLDYQNGDYAAAERHVSAALVGHPDYADLHKIRGDVRMRAGDLDGARASYAEAATINPDYAGAVFGLVITLRREGRGREADAALRHFVARHPEDVMARTLLTVDKIPIPEA